MTTEIRSLPSARTEITIGSGNNWNISGLASSLARVGRQSAMIDNTTDKFGLIEVGLKIRLGSSPAANTAIYLHLIRGNGTERSDGAGSGDAALTQLNAAWLDTMKTGSNPASSDQDIYGFVQIWRPGREWGLMIWQDTGAALDTDNADHSVGWVGFYPEIQ